MNMTQKINKKNLKENNIRKRLNHIQVIRLDKKFHKILSLIVQHK